jgi:hypothetical protein
MFYIPICFIANSQVRYLYKASHIFLDNKLSPKAYQTKKTKASALVFSKYLFNILFEIINRSVNKGGQGC